MLQQYFERTVEIHETLPIFTIIIDTLVEEYTDIRHLKQLVFVVRGMVYEATRVLDLPCEIIQYTDSAQTIPENYKMLARSLYGKLHELQARVEFANNHTLKTYPAMANALTTRNRKVDRVGKEHHPTIPRI